MPCEDGQDQDAALVQCPRCAMQLDGGRFQICPRCVFEDDLPGVLAERYQLEQLLGRGGAGRVYRARDLTTGKLVAVKLLDDELSGEPELEMRFAREAQALRLLHHPGIVGFREFAREGERTYIVMELVVGQSLQALLPLAPDRALDLFLETCAALEHAHSRGVVHRDLKPTNVLVDTQGRVKLADFGIAAFLGRDETRLTRTSQAVGTLDYMAPEARLGAPADPRQDIYSLGVVLYQMLTGHLPLGRFDLPDGPIGPVLARALSTDPGRRQPSVQALQRELVPGTEGPSAPARARTLGVAVAFACASMLALAAPGRALRSGQLASVLAPLALSVVLCVAAELCRRALPAPINDGASSGNGPPDETVDGQGYLLAAATLALGCLLLELAPPEARWLVPLELTGLLELAALSLLWLRALDLLRTGRPLLRDGALAVATGQLLLGASLPFLALLRQHP